MGFAVISFANRFKRAETGSIALSAGILFTVLGGATLFAIDYTQATKIRSNLQRAADTASLSLARQLPFLLVSDGQTTQTVPDETLTAIVKSVVDRNTQDMAVAPTTLAKQYGRGRIEVTVSANYDPIMGRIYSAFEGDIYVQSTAESFGGEDICLISLGVKQGSAGIDAADSSKIQAANCGIYSSAQGADSLTLSGGALIDAQLICSAGGYNGADSNTSTQVVTDCQQIPDPLADRVPAPDASLACDHNEKTYDGGTHTMEPGVYCGKTDLRGGADVRMNPGDYIFRGGDLHTHDTSRLTGVGVSLYFDDKDANIEFLDTSMVDLSAPETGPMAGILIASRDLCPTNDADGTCKETRTHKIESTDVRRLLGTLHLPSDIVSVDTTMPVSSEAAFTIVVTGKLDMTSSPQFVLNTDYTATNVPVPQGFSGMASARIVK